MQWLNPGLAAMAAALVLSIGCAKRSDDPSAGSRLKTVAVASVGEVPNEDECWEFAYEFEEAMLLHDSQTVSEMIDWEAIAEAATDQIDASSEVERNFTQGLVARCRNLEGGLSGLLSDAISEGATLTPLRVIKGKTHPIVRFRLINVEGALNYLDFSLARRPDGSIKAVDLLPHAAGEPMTQMARRFYLTAVAESQRSVFDRLTGKEQAFVTHLPTMAQMNADLKAGRHAEVLSAYHSLPEELRRERIYLVARFSAASVVDEADYIAALDDFDRFYPDDPSTRIHLIDRHFLRGEFDEAIAAIDRLDEAIGGDPYLLVLRAAMDLGKDDWPAARARFELALDQEPSLLEAYWGLINLSLIEEDYDETVRLLDLVNSNFELEPFVDLTEIPEYDGFVRSPQFADWQSRQPSPPAPETAEATDEPPPADEVPPDF